MANRLINLKQLRAAAERANGLIGQVAAASAEAIEEVAAGLPVARQSTLAAAGWVGSGPYTQTVTVAGVRADEAGQLVQVIPASESLTAWSEAGVLCTGQGAGTLTFSAQEKPSGNIAVFVILQEVRG